jgi:benzoate transport
VNSSASLSAAEPLGADIRDLIRTGPIGNFQLVALAVCVGLNMLDGFDVLVMSFAATGVSAEWALSGRQLGLLLSAGLVGMAAGALLLGPLADRLGRRSVILSSLWIAGLGMLLSGFSQSFLALGILRVLTGIGIGGILASATVLIAEYASDRWRNTASCLYTAGYALGATAGGAVAAILIARFGWRAAFQFGAVMSLGMLPFVYRGLPESVDFLITRRPANALPRLNALLERMNRATISLLPPGAATGETPQRGGTRRLFTGSLARGTTCLWIEFFFMMAGYYFVFGWTPRLLTASGFTAGQGITSGVLLNLGGIVGTVVFAFIARLVDIRRLTCGALFLTGVLMLLFAYTHDHLALALITGVMLGGMANCAMAGSYALTPPLYPTGVRTTGMGWAIGVGRFGAIVSPIAAGAFLDVGWPPMQLYVVFSGVYFVGTLALALITRWGAARLAT